MNHPCASEQTLRVVEDNPFLNRPCTRLLERALSSCTVVAAWARKRERKRRGRERERGSARVLGESPSSPGTSIDLSAIGVVAAGNQPPPSSLLHFAVPRRRSLLFEGNTARNHHRPNYRPLNLTPIEAKA